MSKYSQLKKIKRGLILNTIIILDTNFLRKKRLFKNIEYFIQSYENIADIFTTETVIDELTMFYKTIFFTEVLPQLEKYPSLYEILGIDYKISSFSNISERDVAKEIRLKLIDLFGGNIIAHRPVKINDIYKRAIQKKPPFSGKDKKSDDGFKDTMIWLSILNYSYENYANIIFVSNDNDFKNNKTEFSNRKKILTKEFEKKHKKPIKIYGDAPEIKGSDLENSPSENSSSERSLEENPDEILKIYEKMSEFREKLNKIIDNTFAERVSDINGSRLESRFDINKSINISDYDSFKKHLNTLIKENIISDRISASIFLQPYLSEDNIREYNKINVGALAELLKLMTEFEKELPNYKDAFLSKINSRIDEIANINEMEYFMKTNYSTNIIIDDEDLPF